MTRTIMTAAMIFGYCAAYDGPVPSGDRNHIDIDAVFVRSRIGRSDLRIDPAPIKMLETGQNDSPSPIVLEQYPNPF